MSTFGNPIPPDARGNDLSPDDAGSGSESSQVSLSSYLLLSLFAVCGFVGLLVSSHYWPAQATPLCIAALVWLLAFGVMRAVLVTRRRKTP